MGWNDVIFPLLIFTSSGAFTGEFGYSPGPGANKLVSSDTAQAGTDPFGNAYLAGKTTYFALGGHFYAIQIWQDGVAFYSTAGASQAGPYTLGASIAPTVAAGTINGLQITVGSNSYNLTSAGALELPEQSSVPPGAAGFAALAADATGTAINLVSPSTFVGALSASPAADFTQFTVVATVFTQFSKAWSIPAGDAQVGTTYRLTVIGDGTQGAVAEAINFQFSNGDAGAGFPATFAGAGASFTFKLVFEITVATTGAGGTADYNLEATVNGSSQNGFTPGGAFNNAVAFTLEAQAKAAVAGPTLISFHSYYERLGP